MRALRALGLFVLTAGLLATPAATQVRTVDPNSAIDADLRQSSPPAQQTTPPPPEPGEEMPVDPGSDSSAAQAAPQADAQADTGAAPASTARSGDLPPPVPGSQAAPTYDNEDVLSAAEGVFGKGAKGLASMIEDLLKKQGRPNAYIAGREAGGALVVGLRYGSGTLSHKVEGTRPVYWTGPSVGFDVGGDANKVFVLVYNLYDTQELYRRFPAAEGRVYFVGGFAATYLRRGNIVLIPIRLGVGWRLGANVGYMKFSEKSRWLPF
ncbi:DUF1134 domain-containing protein [Sphingomonas cannabina]|uniref:DUF1134 domain-containing protein n=1 Tax=Sphingomonas cannabina TaxID=2899123 RepID=UPI001F1E51CE|nr:DUF1134 domain-containing protein [Sphingomonas cannabina]UIJ45864.1 DUF1134 domain-containing protein [Sphingomonas cannabina]